MKKYGLIGYPLTHSFSERYFKDKFEREGIDAEYRTFELPNLSELDELLKDNPELLGLNVTIPHKIGVMFYLQKVDAVAREIHAVNCIKIVKNKPVESFFSGEFNQLPVRLEGYNTDAYGFEESLKPLLAKHHQKALILGHGGAARAVAYVLKKLDISYRFVSRRPTGKQLSYSQLSAEILRERTVIVNTTPCGTYPKVDEKPRIPYEFLTDRHLLYDLVYNPEETLFLKLGKERGATIKNGYEMLQLQAEKSWEIWNS